MESELLMPFIHQRAYDESRMLVLGTIILPINLDPIERDVEFHVLDIPVTFNLI